MTSPTKREQQEEYERELRERYATHISPSWRDADDLTEPTVIESQTRLLHTVDDFARAIVAKFPNSEPEIDLDSISRVLQILFYASLETEEKRSYPLRLELADESTFGNIRSDLIRFGNRIEATPQSLAKLSPSIDHTRANLLVEASNPPSVWGMVFRDPAIHKWITNSAFATGFGYLMPFGLVLRSIGPGHLIAEHKGNRLAELRRGDLFQQFVQVFVEDGPIRRFLEGHKLIESPELSSLRDPIHQLVAASASSGHGGTIAIVGDDDLEILYNSGLVDPGILVGWHSIPTFVEQKRALAGDENRAEMPTKLDEGVLIHNTFCAASYFFRDACKRLADARLEHWESSKGEEGQRKSNAYLSLRYSETYFDDAINSVSYLSRPDGALLLGTGLQLYSYTSKIQNVGHVDAFRSLNAGTSSIEKFSEKGVGTRHRSAIWLASKLRNSCVFVISEDGIVSAIKHWRGRVVVWRPVTVDRANPFHPQL